MRNVLLLSFMAAMGPAFLACAVAPMAESGLRGGARSLALGEAPAAALEGPESAYWNPAGMAGLKSNTLEAGHTSLAGGLNSESLMAQFDAGNFGAVGLDGYWDNLGGLEQRDSFGNQVGQFDFNS